MANEPTFDETLTRNAFPASADLARLDGNAQPSVAQTHAEADAAMTQSWSGIGRIFSLFAIIVVLAFAMNAMITSGLRRTKTSLFGVENQIMEGKVNAQVLIAGSSRAIAHYDPRVFESITGHTAYNVGRNGAQTDMQVAFLKAYLAHNQKPQVVIFNLDAFTFVTSRDVFDPVEYTPYLYDPTLYDALRKINPGIWKSKYIPLYGYVVEDMNFSWVRGLRGFFGWNPKEDFFLGFNPRTKQWTDDFARMKENNPNGVRFEIQPRGISVIQDLIRTCQQNGIQLIFVYSPEYSEMQALEKDRPEVFKLFHDLSQQFNVPFWDYSDWKYSSDRDFFQNSQHLNSTGAEVFSEEVANQLKTYLASHSQSAENSQLTGRLDHPTQD